MPLSLDALTPLDWQAEAMRAVLRPVGGSYAWAGGKGSGKSVLVGAIACLLAATRPGAEIALVMDSYPSLRDIHLPIISALARSAGGEWRATDTEFRWPSGSVIRLRHLDTTGDPRIGGSPIEGMNLHAIIADECQQIDARYWTVWQERARVQCRDAAGNDCAPLVVASGLPVGTWWVAETIKAGGRTWRPATRVNVHNDPGYEARVRASMTERQARAMLDGEEYAPEGQIVEEFVPRLEPDGVLTDWQPDYASSRTLVAMDLGANNPHALLFVEDAERGRWVVMREWYSTGRRITLGQFCARINADCIPRRSWNPKSALIPVDEVVTDPAGAAHSAQTGHSDLDLIAGPRPDGLGIRPIIETIPERRGVMASLNRLRLAIERHRLMFSRSMVEAGMRDDTERSLAKSLIGYRWDPRGRDEPLKDDVHDHACFPGETPILMADGSWKRIDAVQRGDMVQTRTGARAVLDAAMTNEWGIVAMLWTSAGIAEATGNHPFFTPDGKRDFGTFRRGDVLSHHGGPALVLSSYRSVRCVPVYNLTVDVDHEYCAGGFWVSNCDALRYGARRVLWHIVEAEVERATVPTAARVQPAALRHARAGR